MKASFRVGKDCEVEIDLSLFGLEIYSANGEEVLRLQRDSLGGSRTFVVADGEKKRNVEIKIDFFKTPKSWLYQGEFIARAYVDGELVVDDLFPKFRRNFRQIYRLLHWLLFIIFSLLVMLLVAYYFLP